MRSEHKFLGLVIDSKLSFVSRIKKLKLKCTKYFNIFEVLSYQSWGSDRLSLAHLSFSGSLTSELWWLVYGPLKAPVLKMLDPIQGLRLSTGTFRTSPISSLYAEAKELFLEKRRFALEFMYSLRIRAVPLHPAHDSVVEIKFQKSSQNKPPSFFPPFALKNNTAAELFGLDSKPP